MFEALQPILFSYDPEQEGGVGRRHSVPCSSQPPAGRWSDRAGDRSRWPGSVCVPVEHLAHGRRGRRVRRICGDTGRRLLRITTMEARAIRFRPVPVRPSRYRLRSMVAAGWTADRLADGIGLSIRDVEQVLDQRSTTCPQLAALKISAAYDQWETEQELGVGCSAVA